MLKVNLHRLLRRQIRNAGLDAADLIKFKELFNSIDQAYRNFDNDVKHIEVIFEERSNELYKLNRALKSKIDNVENELNTIVNTIDGVIFKTNLRGDFLYLNQAWEEMTHYSTSEAIGRNFKDFLTGENESGYHKVKKVLREGNRQLDTFFKYHRKDGEEFWVQLKLDFIKNSEGKISGTIGTMTDITQLKQTEIELNKANKVKDEFLSMMSHEIRTPLNSVIGTSVLLLMDKSLPEQAENLKVLKHSSEHLLALINDLLDLNKYKSKEIKLDIKDFNLSETVQNLQLEFSRTSQHKNLKFDTVLDTSIPSVVKGDNLKLSQILKNLLSNAFKFTNEGTVTFKIERLKSKTNQLVVRFTVSDTGIGVSYDKQKDIFKSFVQANEDTSKLYGGTGLGLYICKQLLKLQGSNLELESEKGRGSTFWFDIKFEYSDDTQISKPPKLSKNEPIQLKVLVAEDNKLNILLLKKLFEKWKVDFTIAENGKELLDIYKKEDYDLILMDLQMPILDGYDTARYIRKLNNHVKSSIPIIALTAFSKSEVHDKIAHYQMNGYLSKPLDVNELYELLKNYSNSYKELG